MHHCDNPPCFLYAHLKLTDQAENLADASAKGRMFRPTVRGELSPKAKITGEQVIEIRARQVHVAVRKAAAEIAEEFGISARWVLAIWYEGARPYDGGSDAQK
jgi:hypothetical protein